ncbi:hypothetical protein CNMCM6069_001968 [Aspergillus lentulus]|nr:hypothetical protein CNMCM6069_001968 [Aspergillus lentulus]
MLSTTILEDMRGIYNFSNFPCLPSPSLNLAAPRTLSVASTLDPISNSLRNASSIDPAAYALTIASDPAQKICILTGAGGTFCAGADLHAVAAAGTGSSPSTLGTQENLQPVPVPSNKDERVPSLGPMGPTRLHLSKPLIAAIAGHAVAGGLELALLADLRIVEEGVVEGFGGWGVDGVAAVGAVDGDGCDAALGSGED